MTVYFVDANIFIRYLTGDDPVKAKACLELFKLAQASKIALATSESVLSEVVYVLSSKRLYNVSRGRIRQLLYPILSLHGFKLTDRALYLNALDIYATYTIDFEDALIVSHMTQQHISELYSYDRDFDKIPKINRIEPPLESGEESKESED